MKGGKMRKLKTGVVFIKFHGVTSQNNFNYFVNLMDEPDTQEKTI